MGRDRPEGSVRHPLATVIAPAPLNAAFIIPGVFDAAVTPAVAAAVRAAVGERAVGPQGLVS